MSNSITRRVLVCTTILSLFIAIVLPSIAVGQNRGRGHDKRYEKRDDRNNRNYRRDKRKQAKFVNGHDARDGRWDGRGPNRNRSIDTYDRNGRYDRRYRNMYRNRSIDRSNQYDRRYRNVYRNQSIDRSYQYDRRYRNYYRNRQRYDNRNYSPNYDNLYYRSSNDGWFDDADYLGTDANGITMGLIGGVLGSLLGGR